MVSAPCSPLRDESGRSSNDTDQHRYRRPGKRAEEELQRSEAFLAEGERLSLSGSFVWRLDTDEITFSEQLYRTFEFDHNYSRDVRADWGRGHSDDIPLLTDKIEAARTGNRGLNYEISCGCQNGSVKYLRTIAHGPETRGRPEDYSAIQDITERRLSKMHSAKPDPTWHM